ncbi:hypothetical protein [Janthinobacterium sp. NKUCC06_STL]|uniref:hypothetical protein n=1 Tax=Janthinobacterium sp. NKUCC06_STL TaxID=2842127 RepID=UPI001C5BF366|nr:hypothetical protein [Janthinobacterium sp. NKUCC06_STL]MBW3512141.1 hypothetical protein [Janthinobacterium sp. NKUCC06_STL]
MKKTSHVIQENILTLQVYREQYNVFKAKLPDDNIMILNSFQLIERSHTPVYYSENVSLTNDRSKAIASIIVPVEAHHRKIAEKNDLQVSK